MLMFYKDLSKNKIPYRVDAVEFTERKEAKTILRNYYSEHEGKERIELAIYDAELEDGTTLVDVLRSYIDFPFLSVWVVSPLKVYQFDNASLSVVLGFSKNIQEQVDMYKKTAKVNIIDHIQYFFIGHGI